MNILLIIIGIIAGIIALLLIAALFVKKEYIVSRHVVINKALPDVFSFIAQLKNQDLYNKWVMEDPAVRKTFTGTDGTPGFIYAWDSDNKRVGKGEQEIKTIANGQHVDTEVRFIKPFEGKADARFVTTAVSGDQTQLQWQLKGAMKYPFNLMMVLMNTETVLGKDIDTSLNNVKTVLEK
ncbi:MAG: SRPBCC family protein [Chitinophagaceae bacterium]